MEKPRLLKHLKGLIFVLNKLFWVVIQSRFSDTKFMLGLRMDVLKCDAICA
jgi:hypothetical protein